MQVFHITFEIGDSDHGALYGRATVTFDCNTVWDEDAIEDMRDKLAEFYDTGRHKVLTGPEQGKEERDLTKHLEEEITKFNQ